MHVLVLQHAFLECPDNIRLFLPTVAVEVANPASLTDSHKSWTLGHLLSRLGRIIPFRRLLVFLDVTALIIFIYSFSELELRWFREERDRSVSSGSWKNVLVRVEFGKRRAGDFVGQTGRLPLHLSLASFSASWNCEIARRQWSNSECSSCDTPACPYSLLRFFATDGTFGSFRSDIGRNDLSIF